MGRVGGWQTFCINIGRSLATIVLLLSLVSIVIGAVFIGQGVTKNNQLKEAMVAGGTIAWGRIRHNIQES